MAVTTFLGGFISDTHFGHSDFPVVQPEMLPEFPIIVKCQGRVKCKKNSSLQAMVLWDYCIEDYTICTDCFQN